MLNQPEKKRIPILMYHSISCSSNPRFKQFTAPPTAFAEQMAYLYTHQYVPITGTQLVQARVKESFNLPERPVVLTFDDGYAGFFTAALPGLTQYGFVVILYARTGFLG